MDPPPPPVVQPLMELEICEKIQTYRTQREEADAAQFQGVRSLVDLPGLVNDPKWGKLGPVRTSLSKLVMFFFVCVCVDHEFHVRFDHR